MVRRHAGPRDELITRLEELDADVAILVGHACFLGMITGDKAVQSLGL